MNCLLRCTIETENEISDNSRNTENFYNKCKESESSSKNSIDENEPKKCYTAPKIIRIGDIENYEDLLKHVENFEKNKSGNIEREGYSSKWKCLRKKANNIPCDNVCDKEHNETIIMFVDPLEAEGVLGWQIDIKKDFIILDPYIVALHPGESKNVNFSYHPFSVGKHRYLRIKIS